jgi:DNA-directed RNA polymerase specialized sigma24 family protein
MNYLIHNAKCIQDQGERKRVLATLKKQMTRLQRLGENYPKHIVIDLYFNEISNTQYMISAVVNLKGEIVFVKQKGENLDALVYALFDRMKLTLSKKINQDRKAYLNRRKDRQFQEFLSNLDELQEMKKRRSRREFDKMIQVISRDVAIYIRRRLKSAEMTTAVKRGKFKVQELLDDLYLQLYDEIEQIPEQESAIRSWLYRKADKLLSEKFRELEFEQESFTQLDSIVEHEYRMMEERFTVDADQELVMEEELEGFEQVKDWYAADNLIYGEDEDTLLDEITLQIHQEEIHRAIEKKLTKLPLFKRTVMDLYLINQMTAGEIAEVKQISVTEVEAVIREVNQELIRELSGLVGH